MNRKLCVSLLSIAAFVSAGVMEGRAETLMTRHVREATINGQAKLLGRLPATQTMQLDIVLPMRDRDGLHAFLADLYSSTVPNYRHFLTPAEFTARFGPTQEHYDAVVRYVQEHGLAVVGGSRDGMEVQVRGPVSAIEAAFHVSMLTYQHPTENRIFYAPGPRADGGPAVPAVAYFRAGQLLHSASDVCKKSDYAKAHGIDPEEVVTHATTGSGPSASFLGSDMRAAYYGGTALTGAGQNLGLFEYLGTDLADLTTYFKNVKQTNNVPITLLSTDGTSTSCVYTRPVATAMTPSRRWT